MNLAREGTAPGAREPTVARGTRPITLPPPLGELEERPAIGKWFGGVILVLTVFGAFAVLTGGYSQLSKMGAESDWSWWHYVLALPALGLLYLVVMGVGEALLTLIFLPLRWRGRDHPGWKRAIAWSLIALIVSAPLYAAYYFVSLLDL